MGKSHQEASGCIIHPDLVVNVISLNAFFFPDLSRNVQAGHVEALPDPLLVSGVPRFLLTPTQSLFFFDPYSTCLNRPAWRNLHEPWVLLNFLVWVFNFWVTNDSKTSNYITGIKKNGTFLGHLHDRNLTLIPRITIFTRELLTSTANHFWALQPLVNSTQVGSQGTSIMRTQARSKHASTPWPPSLYQIVILKAAVFSIFFFFFS